jgi:hypothetical protein
LNQKLRIILIVAALSFRTVALFSQSATKDVSFDFYGDSVRFQFDSLSLIPFTSDLSEKAIEDFYAKAVEVGYSPIIKALNEYKEKNSPDDWLYYQLIRKTAQLISPKTDNYYRYTLYKWLFLVKTGYNARLNISRNKMLFYIQCDEKIYNIPSRMEEGKQFVCLNYHDYGNIDFDKEQFAEVNFKVPEAQNSFSYRVTQLPDFHPGNYLEKDLSFNYYQTEYHFKVKLNPQIQTIFVNYPVVDYNYYFNIPLSKETYKTLIPLLKNNIKGMNKKNGIDYLMRFTRYAFLFEKDSETFGKEKRLSPEETLLYEHSDCEDRVALFFYLVKEIYNLPMIVLVYPDHVTIAVELDKPVGNPIVYNGKKYSICEPTPQKQDLKMGQRIPSLSKVPYEIVYAYNPQERK